MAMTQLSLQESCVRSRCHRPLAPPPLRHLQSLPLGCRSSLREATNSLLLSSFIGLSNNSKRHHKTVALAPPPPEAAPFCWYGRDLVADELETFLGAAAKHVFCLHSVEALLGDSLDEPEPVLTFQIWDGLRKGRISSHSFCDGDAGLLLTTFGNSEAVAVYDLETVDENNAVPSKSWRLGSDNAIPAFAMQHCCLTRGTALLACSDSLVRLLDFRSPKVTRACSLQEDGISSAARHFTPNKPGHAGGATCICVDADASLLACGGSNGSVTLWDTRILSRTLAVLPGTSNVLSVIRSPFESGFVAFAPGHVTHIQTSGTPAQATAPLGDVQITGPPCCVPSADLVVVPCLRESEGCESPRQLWTLSLFRDRYLRTRKRLRHTGFELQSWACDSPKTAVSCAVFESPTYGLRVVVRDRSEVLSIW